MNDDNSEIIEYYRDMGYPDIEIMAGRIDCEKMLATGDYDRFYFSVDRMIEENRKTSLQFVNQIINSLFNEFEKGHIPRNQRLICIIGWVNQYVDKEKPNDINKDILLFYANTICGDKENARHYFDLAMKGIESIDDDTQSARMYKEIYGEYIRKRGLLIDND